MVAKFDNKNFTIQLFKKKIVKNILDIKERCFEQSYYIYIYLEIKFDARRNVKRKKKICGTQNFHSEKYPRQIPKATSSKIAWRRGGSNSRQANVGQLKFARPTSGE